MGGQNIPSNTVTRGDENAVSQQTDVKNQILPSTIFGCIFHHTPYFNFCRLQVFSFSSPQSCLNSMVERCSQIDIDQNQTRIRENANNFLLTSVSWSGK